jgi:peptide/nickel transport system permease protein
MTGYIIRRLFLAIPVLLGIVFVVFALVRLIPGDPCRAALGERATDEICDAYIKRRGLDQPIPVQFAIYLGELARGELGDSFRQGRPVTEMLVEKLPVTIELSMVALTFAILVGIPLGIVSAYWHNSSADVATMITANIGVSMPVFWLGLMLQYVFAVMLKDSVLQLPPSGRLTAGVTIAPLYETWGWQVEGFIKTVLDFVSNMNVVNALLTTNWQVLRDALKHLILPAVALGTIPMAIIARMTRSSLLEVMGLDYIRTARAKGLREQAVILRHGLRNAMLPVVTVIGLQFGILLAGAVLTETIFNLSGIGRTLYDAITGRDYRVVEGFTLVVAVLFVAINLIVDLSYAYLDPRVRLD